MIFTKFQIYKFLFITMALCCLTSTINAGRLSRRQLNINSTVIAPSVKTAEVSMATSTANINKTDNKSSDEEEEYKDNDDEEDTQEVLVDENVSAEKNAVQPAADTSLSVWGIVRGLWSWIRDDLSESLFGDDGKTTSVAEGRTFGRIRQLQKLLIPVAFKFGLLFAMVGFLVAVGMKTLFLVKVLVVMNLLVILAKFFTLKTNFGHVEHVAEHHAPVWNWTPYADSGWKSAEPLGHHTNKEIHLHIHGNQVQPQIATGYAYNNAGYSTNGWERRNDPYSAYQTNMALQGQHNELMPIELTSTSSTVNNKQQYSDYFPSNHRMF